MEVFVKVKEKLHQYDSTRPFSSWLYKVAANHCWDLLRRRKIRQDKETEDVETVPLEHPDANQLEQLDRKADERRSTEGAGQTASAGAHGSGPALLLRHDYDEIADELGCGAPLWRGAPARSA